MPTKLYVGRLPLDATAETLKTAFSSCGDILEATIATDQSTGQCLGFGFVSFSKEKAIRKAMRLHGAMVEGKTIQVNPARENERAGCGGRRNPLQNNHDWV